MIVLNQVNTLNRLHYFIQKKATGSPKSLAKKLNISTATLYRYLKRLKEDGANIQYDKNRITYYYKNEYLLKF